MNDQISSDSESHIEMDVQNAYQHSAVESTPESLNQQVLKLARQSLQDRTSSMKADSWVRPLAFAAMAVLSLAAILQFQGAGVVDVAPESQPDAIDDQPAVIEHRAGDLAEAVESTGRHLRQLNVEADSLGSGNRPKPSASPPFGTARDIAGQTGDDLSGYCDAESRLSAESWWECIQELQQNGMTEAARGELDLFRSAHPLFPAN